MLTDWLIDCEMNAVETPGHFLERVVLHYVVEYLHKFLIVDDWSKSLQINCHHVLLWIILYTVMAPDNLTC